MNFIDIGGKSKKDKKNAGGSEKMNEVKVDEWDSKEIDTTVRNDIERKQEWVYINLSEHDNEYDEKALKKEVNYLKYSNGRFNQRTKEGKKKIETNSNDNNSTDINIMNPENARLLYQQKINSTQSTMNIDNDQEGNDGSVNVDPLNAKPLKGEKFIGHMNYERDRLKENQIEMKEISFSKNNYLDMQNIDYVEQFERADSEMNFFQKFKLYFSYFGPGWIVAIAYLDPGNLCSNLNVGLIRSDEITSGRDFSGYYLLWIMVYGHLLGFLFQVLSMKIGHITGLDLATLCRKEFDRKFTYFLYILVQIAVWGAHIQAIVGTFVGLNLLFGISIQVTIFYTLFEALIYSFLENKSTKLLENVLSCLIGVLAVCFFINVFMTSIDIKQLVLGIIYPRIPKGKQIDALALLGSIISAHIFYLHTNLTAKKKISVSTTKKIKRYNRLGIIESGGALLLSCMTNCIIVLTFAQVTISPDVKKDQYSLFTAYEVMKKSFGKISLYIWSIGLLSSGNNSSFMCEYATKSVFEGFLNKKVNTFVRVLGFRLFLFFIMYLFMQNGKYSIDQLTNFINVIQVLLLPLAIVPLYKFCLCTNVLGEEFVLKKFSKYGILGIILLIIASNLTLTVIDLSKNASILAYIAIVVFSLTYCAFIFYFFRLPIKANYCYRSQVSTGE